MSGRNENPGSGKGRLARRIAHALSTRLTNRNSRIGRNRRHLFSTSSGSLSPFRQSRLRTAITLGVVVGLVIAVSSVITGVVATKPTKANAYEDTTATWSGASGGSMTTATQPSGLVTTFTTTGQTTAFTPGSNLSQYSAASSEFTPAISATEPAAYLDSHFQAAGCPVNGTCPSLGTITLTFSQPVTNPVLHFAGVGGSAATLVGGTATSASALQTNFTLTGATLNGTAATATLGSVSAGATNLGVAGSTISDPSNSTSPFCNTAVSGNGIPTTATAGCGSVPIVGTVSSVTFALGGTTLALLGGGNMASGAGDAFQIAVTEDQHFSDAPASYNGSQAPAHIVGDLKLGATVSANNTTVANSTTSPLATTGVAVNSTAAGEDAITSFPTLSTANIGSTYSLTVPISGASQSGQVCGYIDFTEAGNFNAAADKACANFTAGQTSVGLSWTIPAGTTAGTTYARLRAAYGTTQAASPTGLASSGEVEDYELPIVANPLDCTGGTIYALQRGTAVTGTGTSGIYAINTNALGGAITPTLIATSPTTGSAAGAGFANGLAITKGGTAAYFVDQNVTTNGVNGTTVFAYNATTGVWTGFAGATLAAGSSVVAGAIDPTTGIYYYADFPATSNAPSQLITIYGFNTNTNTPIAGVIGTTTLPEAYVAGTNANGDFAFDALGDLYIVSSMSTGAGIGVVKGPLPTTGSATSLTDITLQTSTVGATVAYNGVAFSNTGQMFVQTSTGTATTLFGQNPNTAVVASTSTFSAATGGAYNDLAACSLNPTLSLQKNIAGRVNAGDQFGLSITGGGVAKGNTATTTGATTGLQSVVAGPVVGVSGTTYTLAETASGTTSLASYATTYSCLNQADNNSVVASGSAQSFTLNFPSPPTGESGPNVVCTFTNTPSPPSS